MFESLKEKLRLKSDNIPEDPLQRLLFYYGHPERIARVLGLTRQAICMWIKNGFIPYSRATYVMRKTGGKVKNIEIWLAADKAKGAKNENTGSGHESQSVH